MNRITNVRLHTPTVYEYRKVCDILVSLGIRPPGAYHSEYVFIYIEKMQQSQILQIGLTTTPTHLWKLQTI